MTSPFSSTGGFSPGTVSSAAQDLMSLQLAPTGIEDADTTTATDAILPDRSVTDRLAHFDPALYDLSPDSHLMRLLKVLLGGAGAGGIRKQIAVARLTNSFSGMHFLDLDRFYGALFGVVRTNAELLPDFGTVTTPATFNPMTDAADSDVWDDIHSRDASYRDKIIKFARALPLGGTYPGLLAVAEALFSADCEVYESWELVDEQNYDAVSAPVLVYTWAGVAKTYKTYGAIEASSASWSTLDGSNALSSGGFVGRTGQKNRSEVLIQPKRSCLPDELYEATRVMGRISPAGSQIMVNPNGLQIHTPVPIRAVAADSEYWEVIYKTTVNPALVDPPQPIYIVSDPERAQPRPCFSHYQGESWSYNNEIDKCHSYPTYRGERCGPDADMEYVFADGSRRTYSGGLGLMDPGKALASRYTSDGVMTSFPYAGRAYGHNQGDSSFAREYS